jgi:5-formyltetrahydrofolate cyclo-ligase
VNDADAKAAQRRTLRARRAALGPGEQSGAAERLAANVAATRLFRASGRIALYLPNDGEIGTQPLLVRAWALGKRCFLPLLSQLRHDRLWFAEVRPDTPLVLNRYGIPEPEVPARRWLRAQQLDLILLPLVGFDADGNRLGMGAGFYDRSLSFLRHRRHWRKPHLLGLAHECQRLERLAPESWDVPLDGVVTDRAVYLARR